MTQITLTPEAQRIFELLSSNGYPAYMVGGCVRDILMGRPYHDIDIATAALCSEMTPLFQAAGLTVYDKGIEHGTITVVMNDAHFEVTTFRIDGPYEDYRHPKQVEFTRSLAEDLVRRDFTINAMAWNPTEGLIDLFGGQEDINNKLIRCVSDAKQRFEEDALRIMRALRFSARFDFTIASATEEAMYLSAHLLRSISRERIAEEFTRIITSEGFRPVLLDYTDILGVVIPELLPMKGFDQHNSYHPYDVLEHTVVAMEHIPPTPVLRMAALLHDCGKPQTYDQSSEQRKHFYGHPQKSAAYARTLLERLRYPSSFTDQVCTLVLRHDADIEPTEKNVKRWLRRLGYPTFCNLLLLKKADVSALKPECQEWLHVFDEARIIADTIIADKTACFSLKDLAINGNDLIDRGIVPGPEMGRILEALLDAVIDGDIDNTKSALLEMVEEIS